MKLRSMLRVGLLCLVLLLPSIGSAQGRLAERLLLVEAGADNYPELVFRVGVYDAQNRAIDDLREHEIAASVDGQPITATLQLEQRPPAVVVVADMSFAMNDRSTPLQGRVPAMVGQIRRMLSFLPPATPVSLVAFDTQERLVLDWGTGEAVTPALDAFLGQSLPGAVPDAPYALTGGILLGLEQFGRGNRLADNRPRALFVYAAGLPQQTIDTAAVQQRLAELAPNPPSITLIGLASGTPGEFASQAGNPESLMQAASALADGTYRRYFTAHAQESELLQLAVDAQAQQIANLERLYKLTLSNHVLAPGVHQVELTIHQLSVAQRIRVPAVAPHIALRTSDRPLKDGDMLSADVRFAQQPVQEVSYYLNELPIGSSAAGPDFAVALDLSQLDVSADRTSSYRLAAVGTDMAGRQSQPSSAEVQIDRASHLRATAGRRANLLTAPVALPAVAVAIMVVGAGLLLTPRGRRYVRSLLRPYDQLASPGCTPTPLPENFNTSPSNVAVAANTELLPIARLATPSIVVAEGDRRETYRLSGGHTLVGRGPGHQIALADRYVSRRHAQLVLTPRGVELTDLGSANGTFVGEHKRKLAPQTPELLHSGESFWVGQHVKLTLK